MKRYKKNLGMKKSRGRGPMDDIGGREIPILCHFHSPHFIQPLLKTGSSL